MRTVSKLPSTGTVVTGASDDLIEIDGDLCEEFDSFDCKDGAMAFSDGTVLGVKYDDDKIWRFTIKYKGSCFDHKVEGSVTEDTNDVVYFKEGLSWAVFAERMHMARSAVAKELWQENTTKPLSFMQNH